MTETNPTTASDSGQSFSFKAETRQLLEYPDPFPV